MSEIVSRVNGILEELSEYFNEVEFIYAFPDSELSSPLSEKYRCAVSVECRNTSEDGVRKESCSCRLELLAPVGMSGYEIFSKAADISRYIFSLKIPAVTFLKKAFFPTTVFPIKINLYSLCFSVITN